jgi:GntR family transcriptional repressor for pyruvate dehydrogenase complex
MTLSEPDESTAPDSAVHESHRLAALPRERLIDRATVAIKDYIIAKGLQSNDRLPSEAELAHRLGVSRNVVRQAIASLEAVGIVRTEHGRGSFIAELGSASKVLQNLAFWLDLERLDQQAYLETRLIFDTGVLELAMRRATAADLGRLDTLVVAMAGAEDGEARRQHDAFHLALLDATGNPLLASLGIILYRFFWELAASAPHVPFVQPEDLAAGHRALLDGLRARDTSRIPELVAAHLTPLGGPAGANGASSVASGEAGQGGRA